MDAGGEADPFTDSFNPALHISVDNNAYFNVIQGTKHISVLSGVGTTTVMPGCTLNVGSSGPVGQGTLLVNGFVDAGPVDVINVVDVTASAVPAALAAGHVRADTLNITSSASQMGTVTIKVNGGNAGVSRVNTLTISGPVATPSAKMDLNDNDLVYDYTGATPFLNVYNWIRAGYNSNSWTGNGLTSSMARTSPNPGEGGKTALGYAEATDIFGVFPANWSGQVIDNTSVLVKYTYAGDANLDGQVDVTRPGPARDELADGRLLGARRLQLRRIRRCDGPGNPCDELAGGRRQPAGSRQF